MSKNMADSIIDSSIALYIFASVAIGALVLVFTTALTSVPASVTGLVPLVGVLFILGVALGFYYAFKSHREG